MGPNQIGKSLKGKGDPTDTFIGYVIQGYAMTIAEKAIGTINSVLGA